MDINGGVIIGFLLNIIMAGGLIVIGYWFAGRAGAFIRDVISDNPAIDQTLGRFIASMVRYFILAVVLIAVLQRFGVETTSLVALIGAAGLAVGLALQGTLSNLAAGVMLVAFRPFKVGDYVQAAGHSGTTKEIGLFVTELTTPDNVQIFVPNGDIWASAITNYSSMTERRVDLTFGVAYDADLKTAETALREVIAADDRVRETPAEPFVAVTNLGESSVDFTIRVWCDSGDYWGLRFDLLRAVKERFDADGVDIPFPTTTIVQSRG